MAGTADNAGLPTGRLTLLFTDIEGSTRLLQQLGRTDYSRLLADHHRLLRRAIADFEGTEVKTEGDSFFAIFPQPDQAVSAAAQVQRSIAAASWPQSASVKVRMGIHTGDVGLAEGEYVGLDVHRAARITNASHGGQVLLSEATRTAVDAKLPAALRLRDLGSHRLKDLAEPERLFQLVIDGLPADFPPPRSLEMAASSLPQHLTAFFGREHELADARRLLFESRLVTLTGTGGTGKSRLAVQLAAEVLGEFPDGVVHVPLASLREAELVLPAVAQAFNVAEGDNLASRLAKTIGTRQLLLILDNFEQLLVAAPVVAQLLSDTPRLRVLVTSRARLNVPGEREYVVPTLPVPDPRRLPPLTELARISSIALFVDRARAVRPDFELNEVNAPAIVDICSRVDGLPLAIELAAARVRLLTPDSICERLVNQLDLLATTSAGVSERQRTLRATIQWSYDLLNDDERTLFSRLGVYLGGASLPLIGIVMNVTDELELLERLGSLIDKSLIRRAADDAFDGSLRVELLESIRDFALERLAERGELDEYRERHARAYLALAVEAEPRLTGAEGGRWLDRLEREHDNVRACFGWAVEAGRAELAARLSAALWRFWQMRGHLSEGGERAEQAVRLSLALDELGLRSKAFAAAGSLAYWRADWPAARAHYEAALAVERERDDRAGIAEALYNLSFAYFVPLEDVQHAMDLAEESLASFRDLGDVDGVAKTLWALGGIAQSFAEPRLEQALEYYREATGEFESLGNRPMLAWSLFMAAGAHATARRATEARSLTADALRVFVELGDVSGYALCLHGLAVLEWVAGRRQSAVRLAAAAHAIARASGVNLAESTSGRWLAHFGLDGAALEPDTVEADPQLAPIWAEGAALTPEEAVEEAARLQPTGEA